MDKALYVSMTGAAETMRAQALKANNLANVSTTGFKADLQQLRSMPVYGDGLPTRVYAASEKPGSDFSHGGMITTGNDLDIGIRAKGWFAVQDANGEEAYTRRGDMFLTETGEMLNGNGNPVLGLGGPIIIPPAQKISVADDGTISIVPLGSNPNVSVVLDQFKLVNPGDDLMRKRTDGLFELKAGGLATEDTTVQVVHGALEASNVNAVSELIDLISLARQHEFDVKMMKTTEENDQATARLLRIV